MRSLIIIAHNVRSGHNVGSLLRTAEGLGVERVYLTGYTPYPVVDGDMRLPHIAQKNHKLITKTALGAESSIPIEQSNDINAVIDKVKNDSYIVCALEQSAKAVPLPSFKPPEKIALIVGREVEGLEQDVLVMCDKILEIPMFGKKESFNVVQAAAMALYHLRFFGT